MTRTGTLTTFEDMYFWYNVMQQTEAVKTATDTVKRCTLVMLTTNNSAAVAA